MNTLTKKKFDIADRRNDNNSFGEVIMLKKEKGFEKKSSSPVLKKSPKILVLDDHPIVRQGLMQLLSQQVGLEVCGEAANAEQAYAAIEAIKPDVVVVDISLDGPNGIEFIKSAKEQYPNLLFLVHSMHDETLYAERALRAGARGYIMKQEAPDKVVTAIRRILGGQIYMSDVMTERMLEQRYNGVSENLLPMEALSDRELEVFQLIGRGETTNQIAKLLHRSIKTVETYRARIKEKLNLKDNMQLIRHAMQSVYSEGAEAADPKAPASKAPAPKKTKSK